jgi:hypothetical protein
MPSIAWNPATTMMAGGSRTQRLTVIPVTSQMLIVTKAMVTREFRMPVVTLADTYSVPLTGEVRMASMVCSCFS